jgi:hypothetical protein
MSEWHHAPYFRLLSSAQPLIWGWLASTGRRASRHTRDRAFHVGVYAACQRNSVFYTVFILLNLSRQNSVTLRKVIIHHHLIVSPGTYFFHYPSSFGRIPASRLMNILPQMADHFLQIQVNCLHRSLHIGAISISVWSTCGKLRLHPVSGRLCLISWFF